ncbi:DUF1801 domain-containing protein [Poritiphilus flavus]|uniref:DUF1801 domain-containing protein n=1 Tax=Poritiphilus flavus TaxID=2697053 RepID=A0A6L9EE15_9FLAO|nr:DUF1801 domain-containing protein [Poritiphilus flavus]NAS12960.1 DUF1801 domain-containing protein [Poritiphilus flavus]
MAQNKTIPNNASVTAFLEAVEDPQKKEDSYKLLELMKKITGKEAVMWGPSIVGFGSYHYKYDSGREGDMLLTGFSPRKQNLTMYIMSGFNRYDYLMEKLGKYKTGKSCLYVKKLADVDLEVLTELITTSYEYYDKKYNG